VEGFAGLTVRLRGRTGLTQRQLAARVGVHQRSIQDWEAGLSHPNQQRLQALIGVYLDAGAFIEGLELTEAQALWSGVQTEAPALRADFDAAWFGGLLARRRASRLGVSPTLEASVRGPRRQHWGEAPDVAGLIGRDGERDVLRRWILEEKCRVVAIVGLGGIGKTLLATRLAQDVAPTFDFVYWRSLRNAPEPEEWLASALGFVSAGERAESGGAQLDRLVELGHHATYLLVLDNFETVLQPGQRAGAYRPGFEAYSRLLQGLGESPNRSCLLLTSREEPPELALLGSEQGPVRVLRLSGLNPESVCALLEDKHLEGSGAAWRALGIRHAGNPLALKVAGEAIREFFRGSVTAYLESVSENRSPAFGSLRRLLEAQLQRLSQVERELLLWLAVEREPMTFTDLVQDVGASVGRGVMLEALEGLRRRSMLERGEHGSTFTLPSVVLEYVTEQLVDGVARELAAGAPQRLLERPLLKATGTDDVRRTQERLIATPILDRLVAKSGSQAAAEARLHELLAEMREWPTTRQAFGPGNVVNLLKLLRGNLRAVDLSRLVIRQAYLEDAEAQGANLAGAELAQSIVAEAFAAPTCVALSADGAYLAVGTAVGQVCVWRVADRELVLSAHEHSGVVLSVALTRDGRLAASCSLDGSVKIWDTRGAQLAATLDVPGDAVWGIALSQDGRLVAGGGLTGAIQLWETATGARMRTLQGHTGRIGGLALRDDDQLLATCSQDGTLRLWELPSGYLRTAIDVQSGAVYSVALDATGQLIAAASQDGTLSIWNAAGQLQTRLYAHRGPTYSMALSRDGRLLASGGLDGTVRIWDATTARALASLYGHRGVVRCVSLSADGRIVASASSEGQVRLWETGSAHQLAILHGYTTAVTYVAMSGDGHLVACGSLDGSVQLWDATSGEQLATLRGHTDLVYGVAMSQDGRLVVSGSYDGTLRLWEAPTGRHVATLVSESGMVHQVAASADAQVVVAGSLDGSVGVWDVPSGRARATFRGHTSAVPGVALSEDGARVASGSLDGTVRVWDARRGQPVTSFESPGGPVYCVAISADGNVVACGGQAGTINVWEVASKELVATPKGHIGIVHGLALSRDGQRLASGAEDGMVKLWTVLDGRLVANLTGHEAGVRGVALSADMRLVASGSLDGSLRLWETSTGVALRILRADRRYERMNITGVTGVTEAQRSALIALGAIDADRSG
jgi:WD40 repeat protein/transcriptional regulator with XRE-family HTH domain